MAKNIKEALDHFFSGDPQKSKPCPHVKSVKEVTPSTFEGCEDCLKTGDTWIHLRVCMSCGHVGCCDNSKNKHATKHFKGTSHPIIMSFEPGEYWMWCYEDLIVVDP